MVRRLPQISEEDPMVTKISEDDPKTSDYQKLTQLEKTLLHEYMGAERFLYQCTGLLVLNQSGALILAPWMDC